MNFYLWNCPNSFLYNDLIHLGLCWKSGVLERIFLRNINFISFESNDDFCKQQEKKASFRINTSSKFVFILSKVNDLFRLHLILSWIFLHFFSASIQMKWSNNGKAIKESQQNQTLIASIVVRINLIHFIVSIFVMLHIYFNNFFI